MSTPTPRTDRQVVVLLGKTWIASYYEMHEHACTLERELAAEKARAERAEAELAPFKDTSKGIGGFIDSLMSAKLDAEAELAAAKERLRSEAMDDYAAIKDLQRELATEREIVRVLKLDKDRLDWWNGESYYQFGKSHKCMNPGWWWSCGFDQIQGKSGIKNIRDAIDSAMAHSKSGRNKYNVCKRIDKSETEGAK